jgi:hypothetical protein
MPLLSWKQSNLPGKIHAKNFHKESITKNFYPTDLLNIPNFWPSYL